VPPRGRPPASDGAAHGSGAAFSDQS
jgi:hypothetical protein